MRHLFFIAAFAHAFTALGQSWCPPGAQWTYGSEASSEQCMPSQARFVFVGDTVVDGFQAQRIDRYTQLIWQGTLFEDTTLGFVTRANEDVVWDWNGTSWDTLYWFGAVPGDHWQPWPFGENCPSQAWHVSETATVVMDGVSLRTVSAEVRDNGIPTGQTTTFTERLGGGGGYIFPFPSLGPCDGVFECAWGLMCYSDIEVGTSTPCELTLDIASSSSPSTAKAWPNPSNGSISVIWPGHAHFDAAFYDVRGHRIVNRPRAGPVATFRLESFGAGLYELVLTTPTGIRSVLRIQKE